MSDDRIGESEVRVAELVETFLELTRADRAPGREEFIARHPDVAKQLREALGGLEVVEGVAREAAKADPVPALDGQALGDYRILREIGRGGMGVVYEAEDETLGRRVALKVLPSASLLEPKRLQRFRHEAQAAAQLHHTNIVPVYGVGSDRGTHYYAMQYIEGINLAQAIRDLKVAGGDEPLATPSPLSSHGSHRSRKYLNAVCRLGIQAAEGLDYAHQVGVVHRDVKPANLMVDAGGHVWIMDFGLAQFERGSQLTQTGDLVGTFRYMSPEQALAKRVPIDHRTDVYSLGASLYELVTLEPAMQGDDPQAVLQEISFREPKPPRKRNPSVPPELETILLKAMAKDPGERYETAQELADDLRRFLDNRPIVAKPPNMAQRGTKWVRRHRGLVASACVVLLIASGLLVWNNIRVGHALKEAEANLRLAHRAVDEFLGQFQDTYILRDITPKQRALLARALQFYDRYMLPTDSSQVHFRRAQILSTLGRFDESLASVDRAIALRPGRAAACNLRSIILNNLGQPREALAAADHAVSFDPAMALFHNQRAVALKALGRYEEALEALDRAIELDPTSWAPRSNRGALFCDHLHRPADALADFDAALKARPTDPSLHADRGNALSRMRRWAEALDAYERALTLEPDFVRAHSGRGRALHKLNRHKEALEALDRAFEEAREAPAEPARFALLHTRRGDILASLDRYTEALEAFDAALALGSNEAHTHHNRAWVLLKLKRYGDSLRAYERACELDPETASRHCGRGEALRKLGRYQDALAAFQEASRLEPDSVSAKRAVAMILYALERFPEAVTAADETLELDTSLGTAHWVRGSALARMGKDRLAAQSLERALARGVRFNVNDLAWIYAASADAEVRNPARAVELAKTAVGTKPNEGVFWNTLGVAYHAAGAPNDALAALEKSMALCDGGDAFDWFFVAMSKHKLEQGDARQWFDKAVAWMDEHKPDDPELRRFRAEAAKVLGLEAK